MSSRFGPEIDFPPGTAPRWSRSGPRLMPRVAGQGTGSTRSVPFSQTSKWQAVGPVDSPRLPTVAISSPASTCSPTETSALLMWP